MLFIQDVVDDDAVHSPISERCLLYYSYCMTMHGRVNILVLSL